MRSVIVLLLASILLLLAASPASPPSRAQEEPDPPSRADRFGVYNWNVDDRAFPGGEIDRLNWGATKVAELGSRTIRVYIGARDIYKVNPPGVTDLRQIAASPAYDRLFNDSRFTTYILTTYSRGAMENNWADGFTAAEYNAERDEIRRLGEYLLGNPAFAGKTFIILNWEGDNAIFWQANKRSIWDSYRDWIESRADGVRDARAAISLSQAKLYSGLEFNFIRSVRTGQPCGSPVADPVNQDALANRCVIDYVAPQVSVDYYSYSAWQTISSVYFNPDLSLASELKADLRAAIALVRAERPEVRESNFLIGEYGFERALLGECQAEDLMHEVFRALEGPDGLNLAYAIYWQVVDNFPLYTLIDERYGLFRTSGSGLKTTRAGFAFRREIQGEIEPPRPPCPAIRRPPPAWGVVDAATGQPQFRLNPDSVLEITSSSPFSPSGNTVHIAQEGAKFALTSANTPSFTESSSRITTPLPAGRRPGITWVYVTDANGLDSNAQVISIECPDCPVINNDCGVVEHAYHTDTFLPGNVVTLSGSFSATGNRVVVEQLEPGVIPKMNNVLHDSYWSETPSQINATLPPDLIRNQDALIYVVDAQGRTSNAQPLFIKAECADCGPAMRSCRAILNGQSERFHPGTIASIHGRFLTDDNRVIIEQWDEAGNPTRHTLGPGSRGWLESETRIDFGLPANLRPGRALIYVVDSAGRESEAREITITATTMAVVSAASFRSSTLTPGGIMAAFGNALANATEAAATIPLPTELSGTSIVIKDSEGEEHQAPLFFVSPGQVNFLIPEEAALGSATITVTSGDGSISTMTADLVAVAPGIFTANADGEGAAAALALRAAADGAQSYEFTAVFDSSSERFVSAPIAFGPEDEELFLILFGTGLRRLSAVDAVIATVGGEACEVSFAGAQEGFAGLDQINMRLPRALAGRGEVDVEISVDGQTANVVKIAFQ